MSTSVNSEPSLLFVGASHKETLVMLRELQQAGFQPVWSRVTTIDSFTEAISQENWQFIVLYDRPAFRTSSFSNCLNFLPDATKTILVLTSESENGSEVPFLSSVCATLELYRPAQLAEIVKEQWLVDSTEERHENTFDALDFALEPYQPPEPTTPTTHADYGKYRLLFDQAGDSMFVLTRSGDILEVNQRGCRMFGYTREEFIGLSIDVLVSDETTEQQLFDWDEVESGGLVVIEHQAQHRSGLLLEVEFSLKLLSDNTVLAIVRDVGEQMRQQHGLELQIELEKTIASVATRFVNCPPDEVEKHIVDAMAELCQFVRADKACIYDFGKNKTNVRLSYEWHSPGTEPVGKRVPEASVSEFAWFVRSMLKLETVRLTDLSDLPAEAGKERDFLSKISSSKSFCIVPLSAEGEVTGFLALVNKTERHWSDESVALFETVAGILSSALIRKKTEDKKRSDQQEIRKRERRLDLAVIGSNGGVWELQVDPENIEGIPDEGCYLSPELKAMIGFTDDEFPNSSLAWRERIVGDDWEKLVAAAERYLLGESTIYEVEYRIRHKDGSIRWIHSRGKAHEKIGNMVQASGVDWDVTERKEVEKALAESEERYRSLVELSPIPIAVFTEGMIQFMNRAAIELLAGQDFSSFEDKTFSDFVQPEFRTFLEEKLGAADKGVFRLKMLCKDGKTIDVEMTATPINNLENPATQVVFNDITKRLKVEAELEKSADTLKATLDNTPGFIANIGTGGELWFANDAGVPGFEGKSSARTIFECAPREMHDAIREVSKQVLEKREPCEFETKISISKGEDFWYLTRIGPVISAGEIISLTLCATDITKAKTHEEVLKKSEERFELVVRGSNDGFWDWADISEDQMWWSARMWALLGFEENELEPRMSLLKELIHPEELKLFEDAMSRHLGQSMPLDIELRIRTQADEYRWFRLRGFASRDENKKPSRMSGSLLDITDRKNTERVILASEFNLRKAQELASVGSYEWDFKTGKVRTSDQMKVIFGHDFDGIFDFKHFVDNIVHPEDKERISNAIEETLSESTSTSMEFRIVLPNGKFKILYADSEFVTDPKTGSQKLLGFVQDITERKESEDAVKRSEERLRGLLENSSDAILLCSREGRIVYQSPSMKHIFGYLPDELVGKKGLDLVHTDDKSAAKKILDDSKKKERGRTRGSFRMQSRNGSHRWVEAICSNLLDQPGVGALVLNLRDVTENKQAEDELKRTLEFEELIAKTLTDLVGAEANEVETELVRGLEELSCFLETDRAYIAFFYKNRTNVQHVYEWHDKKVDPVTTVIMSEEFRQNTWLLNEVLKGKTMFFSKIDDFPKEAKMSREACLKLKIKSSLLIPLLEGNDVIGFMGFHAVAKQVNWDNDMVIQLQLIAQSFASTLIRKRYESELRDSLTEKDILLKEIHHRVKNNLQVISSLLNLQSRYTSDEEALEIFQESQSRIRSMALIHERLYLSGDLSRIDFEDYVKHLVSHLFRVYNVPASRVSVSYKLEDISLGIDIAIPCGLIVHELVSNALKHAFADSRKGKITILLQRSDSSDSGDTRFRLCVADNGPGLPPDSELDTTDSLGLRLVNMLVSQLQGELTINTDEGTSFEIDFAL